MNHANAQQRFQLLALHHLEIMKGHRVIVEEMTVSYGGFHYPGMAFPVLQPFSRLYAAQMGPEPAWFLTGFTLNRTFLNTIQATSKRGTTRYRK